MEHPILLREEFGKIVDQVHDLTAAVGACAWVQLDPEGRIETWNVGAEQIFGYPAEEALGQHVSIFYPPKEVAGGVPERNLTAATREGRWETEGWRVRKGGSQFWGRTAITAVRDDQDVLRGFAKVTRNLTDREEAVAKERERVANQHGVAIVHALFGLGLQLQALVYRISDQGTRDEIGEVIRSLDGITTRLRDHLCGPDSATVPTGPNPDRLHR